MDIRKIEKINQVVDEYFANNPSVDKVQAKDLMPLFIKAGIFTQDQREGLPIRRVLRELDKDDKLDLMPCVYPERKNVNTNWYFVRK
ncbi:MAG TPA: hypothetical protein H9986_02810 [Candidatus Prevotella stercoripullorum]|nr:hypothetical protein [Candidatus Prevotella stercoripullorum]